MSVKNNNIGRQVTVSINSYLYHGTVAGKVDKDGRLKVNIPVDVSDPDKGLKTVVVHKSALRY